jgi:hypothetical protein
MGRKRTLFTSGGERPTLGSIMGLVLYAVLIFLGVRGAPIRQAFAYCVLTAILLTVISAGAMNDPTCQGLGCTATLSSLAVALLMTFAIALLCFGAGVGMRKLIDRPRSS